MSRIVSELLQAPARTGLLRLLLADRVTASVRELAERCQVSYEAIRKEVAHLEGLGLVRRVWGDAKLVTANWEHPATPPLLALLALDAGPERTVDGETVRAALTFYGAPLLVGRPQAPWSLEETLVYGVQQARHDGTVLRVLPVVLAGHRGTLDRSTLLDLARRHRVKAELGFLLEFTGRLLGERSLLEVADRLHDRRSLRPRDFPALKSRFEAELAERNTPESAKRWLLRVNMSEDSFRSLLAKHCPDLVHV